MALVFFGPLILATWMYMTGRLQPESMTNRGVLLEPVVALAEEMPGSPVVSLADGQWLLIYVNEGRCDEDCRDALYRQRQIRLMLGQEMERVARVFLHGDAVPDRVFLENEHQGLKTITDKGLATLLEEKQPEGSHSGGIYLVDPLANLVMYFTPDLNPRDVVEDLKHLLELSRIG
jgi:hypothetical protein